MTEDCDRCDALEDRIDDLESQVAQLTEVLGRIVPDDGNGLEDINVGHIPLGRIVENKISDIDAEQIAEDVVLEHVDGDATNTSVSLDREKLLPVHQMAVDLETGRGETLPKQQARAARLWTAIWDRAKGEHNPVDAGKQYYSLDSAGAWTIITNHETDLKNGSKGAIVGRAFEELQAGTKVEDCDCGDIRRCEHGLVLFDDTGNPNRVEADKDRVFAYQTNVETAIESDDAGEQPAEDSQRAEADAAKAADDRLDDLAHAQATQANSDVSLKTRSVLDSD